MRHVYSSICIGHGRDSYSDPMDLYLDQHFCPQCGAPYQET